MKIRGTGNMRIEEETKTRKKISRGKKNERQEKIIQKRIVRNRGRQRIKKKTKGQHG